MPSSFEKMFYQITIDVIWLWLVTILIMCLVFGTILFIIISILKAYNLPLLTEYKRKIEKLREELDGQNIRNIERLGTDKTTSKNPFEESGGE